MDLQERTEKEKLGTVGLMAFVISAMAGGGAYDLPQNMSQYTGLIGQLISWTTAGIIIWMIIKSFMILSEIRPQYTSGLYQYAHAGFGNFAAFFVSWGYWFCQAFDVSAYSILIMSTLNAFWPGTFSNGNTWAAVVGGSIISWIMIGLLLRGVKKTSQLNILGVIVLISVLGSFIITMFIALSWKTFTTNPLANYSIPAINDKNLGNVFMQSKMAMLTTLFEFVGIETAVVISDHAKSQQDVRKATKRGFFTVLILFSLTAILPLGIKSYGQIANLSDPSTSSLMQFVLGPIGRIIITFGVIIAILSSWLSWSVVLCEIPHEAAYKGTFPKIFKKEWKHGISISSLFATGCIVEIIIILTHFISNPFENMISMVAAMIIPPYLISMLYLFKISLSPKTFNPNNLQISSSRKISILVSSFAILGIVFMASCAGTQYIGISFFIYVLGLPIFVISRKQNYPNEKVFSKYELVFVFLICIALAYFLFKNIL